MGNFDSLNNLCGRAKDRLPRMYRKTVVRQFCWLLCFAWCLCIAHAAPPSKLIFEDLEGRPHEPLNAGRKLGSVLIFYLHDCPICNAYAPEINRICAAYTNFSFYIVQVDADLTDEPAKQHAKDYELRAPVLLDQEHRLVKATKAKVTPEAVIIGKNGRVAYRGRIDDQFPELGKKRPVATTTDLKDALEAIQAGRTMKKKETRAVGCAIE